MDGRLSEPVTTEVAAAVTAEVPASNPAPPAVLPEWATRTTAADSR